VGSTLNTCDGCLVLYSVQHRFLHIFLVQGKDDLLMRIAVTWTYFVCCHSALRLRRKQTNIGHLFVCLIVVQEEKSFCLYRHKIRLWMIRFFVIAVAVFVHFMFL